MVFYTGTSENGSDMEQVQGMYISEDGNEWSNQLYPIHRELRRHLNYVRLNLREAHEAMLNNTSKASKRVQKYLIANYSAMNPKH
jgi:hypothetical protein